MKDVENYAKVVVWQDTISSSIEAFRCNCNIVATLNQIIMILSIGLDLRTIYIISSSLCIESSLPMHVNMVFVVQQCDESQRLI